MDGFIKLHLTLFESKKLIAIVIFTLMACLFFYQLIHFIYQDKQADLPPKVVKPIKKVVINTQSILFSSPLFGDYVPPLAEANIKESTLNVEIVGIMYSLNAEESQVLIEEENSEHIYTVGDTLPGGAVIKRIDENEIVVLYNGSLESLSLPKNNLIFNKPAKPLINEE